MCELQTELKEANRSNKKIIKLKPGTQAKLVAQAKMTFKIEGVFGVTRQTIYTVSNQGKSKFGTLEESHRLL